MSFHPGSSGAGNDAIEQLPWDTQFFGVRVGRVFVADAEPVQIRELAEQAEIECLYLFVDGDRLDVIERFVRAGATLVDIRTELDARRPPDGWEHPSGVRPARSPDLPGLLEAVHPLASVSRFGADSRFNATLIVEMYRIWLKRCFDEGMVAVPVEQSQSFVGVRNTDDCAHIDLVYLDPGDRGSGLGRQLIVGALAEVGAERAAVVTQAGNVAALRLYQSLAFRTRSCESVLHLWLKSGAEMSSE